jgi:hypothetical protein
MSAHRPHLRDDIQCAGPQLPARRDAHSPNRHLSICGLDVERSMDHELEIHEPMSIVRCREILGHEADGLSDFEVDQIRRHADAMANVIVEIFLEQRAPQE